MNETVQSQNDTTNETEPKFSNDKCIVTGIYGLRNKINGKWYVGQSLNVKKRWRKYRRYDCKSQRKLLGAMKKYGIDSFDMVLLEECDGVSWILDYREMYWIRHYDSIENGYNIREGGSHGKMSLESRKRMSVAGKGKKKPSRSADYLEHMRMAQMGKKQSEETKRKRSLAMKGRKMPPRSEEHRRRISEAAKERYKDKSKHPLVGHRYTDDDKMKMREALLKYNREKSPNPSNMLGQIAVVEGVE